MSEASPAPKPRKKAAAPPRKKAPEAVTASTEDAPIVKPHINLNPAGVEFRRTVSQGDGGERVRVIQRACVHADTYAGPVDGRYGITLAKAVRQFQERHGLRVTGDVNLATWEAMVGGA